MNRIAPLLLLLMLLPCPTRAAEPLFPGKAWDAAKPADVGMDAVLVKRTEAYALTGGGSGYVVRHGRLVAAWGDPATRYDVKSSSKSIGFTAVGLAIADGRLKLDDRAVDRHPAFGTSTQNTAASKHNVESGWLPKITLRHLATQTAGFEKPGGYGKLLFEPGTKWHYSDAGPNWLAECVTLAYRRDVRDLLRERVFEPIGIGPNDLAWRNNAYRPHELDGVPRREFGSGVSANVDAMARLGLLYLRGGKWGDRQLLPADFVASVAKPQKGFADLPEHDPGDHHGDASAHYGLLWWNNADGTLEDVPRDAYWSWGLHDSLIVVIPSLDLVAARAGKGWNRGDGDAHYDVLRPFLEPLATAVRQETSLPNADESPYPPSKVFTAIEWAPVESIVRQAKGGDNWPTTWADDDRQYTAYGDGNGFKPFVEKKLSTGLAVLSGSPTQFTATNLRSPRFERTGGGVSGEKCSSLLAVDGVLYAWMRNAGNSRLGWSRDRGETWTWADWRFETSFGYPAFLQLGKDHVPANDDLPAAYREFVYVYSHDDDSAYRGADRVVLARVPRGRIADRDAYEFLRSVENGEPDWTRDVALRGAVFEHAKISYRNSIALHPATGRFLYVQIEKGQDTRFEGGLGIYDAPTPWGPWTTVFRTAKWDVGPGETACLPIKWQSKDGRDVHLVFSGDDHFSVRRARLTFGRDP